MRVKYQTIYTSLDLTEYITNCFPNTPCRPFFNKGRKKVWMYVCFLKNVLIRKFDGKNMMIKQMKKHILNPDFPHLIKKLLQSVEKLKKI